MIVKFEILAASMLCRAKLQNRAKFIAGRSSRSVNMDFLQLGFLKVQTFKC